MRNVSGTNQPSKIHPLLFYDMEPPLRAYQKELLDEATRGNIIVFLDTGTGKTRIAAELIMHMRHQLKSRSQIVLFLAPSVPLAMQVRDSHHSHTVTYHHGLI